MTEIEVTVLGQKININTGFTVVMGVSILIGIGVVIEQARSTQATAMASASKVDLAALEAKVDRNATLGDSTLRVLIRLDEHVRSIDGDLDEMRRSVRDLQHATYQRGYDRGAADEAVFGAPALPLATQPAPGSLRGAWNRIGQVRDYQGLAKRAADATNRQLGTKRHEGPMP